MKTIKGVFISINSEFEEVVEINSNLDSYYELLECDTIDIVSRKIGDRMFDIICDDEGLCKANPKITAIDENQMPMLVGNLFIVKFDGVDDVTSLNDEEIEYVKSYIFQGTDDNGKTRRAILADVSYD